MQRGFALLGFEEKEDDVLVDKVEEADICVLKKQFETAEKKKFLDKQATKAFNCMNAYEQVGTALDFFESAESLLACSTGGVLRLPPRNKPGLHGENDSQVNVFFPATKVVKVRARMLYNAFLS